MKTIVCCNVLTSISSLAYSSHCQEWFRMARDFPNDDFVLYNPHRWSIDRARNEAVRLALDLEADYVYFMDDDMILSPSTYKRLREAEKDVIMAHTIIRGYPFDNMMFIDPADPGFEDVTRKIATSLDFHNDYKKHAKNDLVRCDAIGTACALFKLELFREVEPPWFVTMPNATEDVFCCMKLQKHFGRQYLHVYTHLGVPTGHILDPEIVSIANREILKDRFNEDFKVEEEKIDRGVAYSSMVEEVFQE